jgi:hypothetical protein
MRLLALMSLGDAPAPMPVTVVSQPVTPMTVAAALAPVQAAPASPVAPVGVRQDYIVQAESAEVARGAVLRVGGVVTESGFARQLLHHGRAADPDLFGWRRLAWRADRRLGLHSEGRALPRSVAPGRPLLERVVHLGRFRHRSDFTMTRA